MHDVLLACDRLDVCTPPEFLDLVRALGPIALDPAGSRRSVVQAKKTIYPPRGWKKQPKLIAGGLAADWRELAGDGLIYVNPPYGRHVAAWSGKIAAEAQAGAHLLALVAARTDTAWFQGLLETSPVVALLRGRITYLGESDPAPFPNAVFYWPGKTTKEKNRTRHTAYYRRRWFYKVFGARSMIMQPLLFALV